MAKKYRRRRYYRSKGRWSANIKPLASQAITATANTSFFATSDLCQNPAQSENTVSQQYTVKNIEISSELEVDGNGAWNNIESLIAYVMYVPQGMLVTETYPSFHPEYIMAMRFIGSPEIDNAQNGPGRNPLKIRTRLARRLQTGDKVILLITGLNQGSTTVNLSYNGLIRWWTKAN